MGHLGIIFRIQDSSKEDILGYNNKILKRVLVFIENEKIKETYVLGFENLFPKEKIKETFFISNEMRLAPLFLVEGSRIRYLRISLYDKKIFDLKDFLCYLPAGEYRQIRELADIANKGKKEIEELMIINFGKILEILGRIKI